MQKTIFFVDLQLDNGYTQILQTLEEFRKKQIGGVKTGKKKFDKQTAKFCQCQERYLNLTVKKQNTVTLQEVSLIFINLKKKNNAII